MFLRNEKNLVSEEVNQHFYFFYVLTALDVVRIVIVTIRLTQTIVKLHKPKMSA